MEKKFKEMESVAERMFMFGKIIDSVFEEKSLKGMYIIKKVQDVVGRLFPVRNSEGGIFVDIFKQDDETYRIVKYSIDDDTHVSLLKSYSIKLDNDYEDIHKVYIMYDMLLLMDKKHITSYILSEDSNEFIYSDKFAIDDTIKPLYNIYDKYTSGSVQLPYEKNGIGGLLNINTFGINDIGITLLDNYKFIPSIESDGNALVLKFNPDLFCIKELSSIYDNNGYKFSFNDVKAIPLYEVNAIDTLFNEIYCK